MNRQIRRLGLAMLVLYLALFAQLNWVQVFGAERYTDNPNNRRQIIRDFARPRGDIVSADGEVLARTVDVGGRFERLREYPTGDLFGHVTGAFSFSFGTTGIERTYNAELAGRTADIDIGSLGDLFVEKNRTADVTLTIRRDVQQAAKDALGEQAGAVVALDPTTGAVLALWSWPSFDPTILSSHDLENVENANQLLNADPRKPLRARSFQERYFPGSTFKIVTAAAGLSTGKVRRDEPKYPTEESFTPPQTTRPLRNFGGNTCGGDLFEILRVSCNTAFARMALDIGAVEMNRVAESFGFNERPPLDLPAVARSAFPEAGDFDQNLPVLAQSGIGQNSVQATPLQMALAAAAVANKGMIMKPHVMAEIRDSEGEVIDRADPSPWREAITPAVAATMHEAMRNVADQGTARGLLIPGMEVGGKTGTAQVGSDPPSSHAWIIGFAGPPGQPAQVAVAVIVEAQPGVSEVTGGRVAAPIARAVMEKVLQTRAAPAPAPAPANP